MAGHRFVRLGLGPSRLLNKLTARPRVLGYYLFARWKRLNGKHQDYLHISRLGHKPRTELQRGWMPGRWRLDGMRASRRVIEPAVRFMPQNRVHNEVIRRRRKQGAYPPLPWEKKKPKHHIRPHP